MSVNQKITIKNFKCFNDEGGTFERIKRINVIIGKNNSGKSSLIDLIRFLVEGNEGFFKPNNTSFTPEVIIEHCLTEKDVEKVFSKNTSSGPISGNHFEFGKRYIGKRITYKLVGKNNNTFLSFDDEFPNELESYIRKLSIGIQRPFAGKTFANISAERDITPEKSSSEIKFAANGAGSTNIIQQIINRTDKDSRLIEDKLLEEINLIVNPDISFKRILVQLGEDDFWEIFFIDNYNNRVALSKMGSGVKTVILVLLNLIVKPGLDNKEPKNYVFAFEELENNLHPSLQRRLYTYLKNYSVKNSCYFFLTTHSNIVIDSFSTFENSQLIHIVNNGISSKTDTIISYTKTKQIIDDLGLKASDILQTNGVIWVEGPSDRNYINKWIELIDPDLKEGLHYSVMFYGGRLLSNLSFDFEWLRKELIPLLKINRNAFVVIDRDGKGINAKLNRTKERIGKEIGEGNCWITRGREIENYLTETTITTWLKQHHKIITNVQNDKNEKLENNILHSGKGIKLDYSSNKTIFSSEIIDYITLKDLEILDLKLKLFNLIEQIKKWNLAIPSRSVINGTHF